MNSHSFKESVLSTHINKKKKSQIFCHRKDKYFESEQTPVLEING